MPFSFKNAQASSTNSRWLQNTMVDRLPRAHISLNKVSDLSLSSLLTILTARAGDVSPVKKLIFTGSFNPTKAGASTASVAEVSILLLRRSEERRVGEECR